MECELSAWGNKREKLTVQKEKQSPCSPLLVNDICQAFKVLQLTMCRQTAAPLWSALKLIVDSPAHDPTPSSAFH